MTKANVRVTVEFMVDGDSQHAAIEEAKRVMASAMKDSLVGWFETQEVQIIQVRDD